MRDGSEWLPHESSIDPNTRIVAAYSRRRRWREERRQLIEEARQNGVTTEERDGRTFTVLRLAPQYEP